MTPPVWPEYAVPLHEDFAWTPLDREAPIAYVKLVEGKTVNQWKVLRCPFCGEVHFHGAGDKSDNPRAFLGGRLSHCWDTEVRASQIREEASGEYRLVEWNGQWLPGKREIRKAMLRRASAEIRSWPGGREPIRAELRAACWDKSEGRCWYCGTQMNPFADFHVDHVHPVSRGGSNSLANLVPACESCNMAKRALLLEQFRSRRGGGRFWFEEQGL